MGERWVLGEGFARHLGVLTDTVYHWVKSGGLPPIGWGGFESSTSRAWTSGPGLGEELPWARDEVWAHPS